MSEKELRKARLDAEEKTDLGAVIEHAQAENFIIMGVLILSRRTGAIGVATPDRKVGDVPLRFDDVFAAGKKRVPIAEWGGN